MITLEMFIYKLIVKYYEEVY